MIEKSEPYFLNQKSPKRRLATDCNYSVFTTLLMRFLKQNDLYKLSRNLAKTNRISEEKNYSIIFLRIGIFIFEKVKKNIKESDAVGEIFYWLQNQIDECVTSKYKDHPEYFRKMVKSRNRELLLKIKKVFEEGDFNCQQNLKKLIIEIYQKKGKRHSRTHQKLANELAKLVIGVAKHGEKYCYKNENVKIQEIQHKRGDQEDSSFAGICTNDQLILSTDHQIELESLCEPEQWNYFGDEKNQICSKPTAMLDLISSEFLEDPPAMYMETDYLFNN